MSDRKLAVSLVGRPLAEEFITQAADALRRDAGAAGIAVLLAEAYLRGARSGIRRPESKRRQNRAAVSRKGSLVWCNPISNWSRVDLNDYRRANPGMPRNDVAANLHKSGECLCGCYAKADELEEIGFFYPEVLAEIRALEAEVAAAGFKNCRWGGGSGSPCAGACNL